jgi:hypothetical protein
MIRKVAHPSGGLPSAFEAIIFPLAVLLLIKEFSRTGTFRRKVVDRDLFAYGDRQFVGGAHYFFVPGPLNAGQKVGRPAGSMEST